MTVQRQIDLAGTLLSPDQARVSAEAAGVVRRVLVEIGREVGVGTPLVELEPRELKLALERAEAALLQTRAQLGMSGPVERADLPPPDAEIASVKTATANRDDARAGVRAGEGAQLPAASRRPKCCRPPKPGTRWPRPATSPRSTRCARPGPSSRTAGPPTPSRSSSSATPSSAPRSRAWSRSGRSRWASTSAPRTVVATIVQMSPLKLRTGVQERHAGVVEPGQPVQFRVEAFGDRLFTGKVAYVSPALDQTMRTFTVEALVDNPERLLKPGFFAKGVILTRLDTERAGGAGPGGVGAGRGGRRST